MRTSGFLLPFVLASSTAAAQALATADQGIRLQTYVLGTYEPHADWFSTSAAKGLTVGGNLNLFHFGRIQPSLDARVSTTFGSTRETFLGGGPRVQVDFGRVHPYVNYLVGYGTMNFTSPVSSYSHDNALVRSVGGGVDFSLGGAWGLRVDLQHQTWGVTPAAQFSPNTLSIGLRYQFHFKNRNGPE